MAEVQKRSRWSRFLRKFRDILIAGLVVTVPIGLTIWIFAWLFTQIDQLLRPLVKLVFGREMVVSAGRMSPKDVGDKMVQQE